MLPGVSSPNPGTRRPAPFPRTVAGRPFSELAASELAALYPQTCGSRKAMSIMALCATARLPGRMV
jgi:hypothetical protein